MIVIMKETKDNNNRNQTNDAGYDITMILFRTIIEITATLITKNIDKANEKSNSLPVSSV